MKTQHEPLFAEVIAAVRAAFDDFPDTLDDCWILKMIILHQRTHKGKPGNWGIVKRTWEIPIT